MILIPKEINKNLLKFIKNISLVFVNKNEKKNKQKIIRKITRWNFEFENIN